MATPEELAKVAERVAKAAETNDDPSAEALVQEATQEPAEREEAPEVVTDPEVDKASKGGWQDRDTWVAAGKDPSEWVPAKVFNKNGALYESIQDLKRRDKDRESTTSALFEQNRKLTEQLIALRKGEKLKERDTAIESGDKDAVRRLDTEIQKIDKDLEPAPKAPEVSPEVQGWIKARPWLNNPRLGRLAKGFHQEQLDAGDTRPVVELLDEVETRLKRAYPEDFPEARKEPAKDLPKERKLSAVEVPGNGQRAAKREKGWSELPDEAKQVGREYIRRKVFASNEEYAKNYWSSFQ